MLGDATIEIFHSTIIIYNLGKICPFYGNYWPTPHQYSIETNFFNVPNQIAIQVLLY